MNPFDLPPIFYPVVLSLTALGWIALIAVPGDRRVNLWFSGIGVPLALCGVYMYFLVTYWFLSPRGRFADFLTLPRVLNIFQNSGLLLVALINILAMSLVVGGWMARRATQTEMPFYLLRPSLVVMALFPGLGFIVFCIVASFGGRWDVIASVEAVPDTESQPAAATPLAPAREGR
jgi:hypothetical protein